MERATGNVGGGTVETTSSPAGGSGATGETPPMPAAANAELDEGDFKKDGTLRKDTVRRLEESVSARGAERSFNEVTGETTVTTTLGGRTVTFVEEGDTRGEGKR